MPLLQQEPVDGCEEIGLYVHFKAHRTDAQSGHGLGLAGRKQLDGVFLRAEQHALQTFDAFPQGADVRMIGQGQLLAKAQALFLQHGEEAFRACDACHGMHPLSMQPREIADRAI